MSTLRVKNAFAVQDRDGAVHAYPPGRLVDSDDPIVTGRELHFEAVEVVAARMSGGVEAASAAPGEQRTRTTPRKRKPAAKKSPAKPKTPKV